MDSKNTNQEDIGLNEALSKASPVRDTSDTTEKSIGTEPVTSRWACISRTDLIPVKLFYFMLYVGLGMIVPYTPIFLKEIGFSALQIGLAVGVRQLLGSLTGVVLGFVADRFRVRRMTLLLCLITLLGFNLILYLMPYPKRSDSCPTPNTINRNYSSNENIFIKTSFAKHILNRQGEPNANLSDILQVDDPYLKEDISWIYESSSLLNVFIAAFILGCACDICQSPSLALLDALTLQIIGREGVTMYGSQRAAGTTGWAIG